MAEEREVAAPQRRVFLYWMLGGLGGVLAAAAAWPVLSFLAPRRSASAAATVSVPLAKVPVGTAHFFDFRGRPAVVVQGQAGTFIAMSAICTHLGCIVKWVAEEQHFLCPCHGGQFSATGAVLAGPPTKALDVYPVSVQGDQLQIG
jgi:cytochrome b6-f complex iron-sulfur subunit